MIDQKLYCETFSRLRASQKAKEEVFHIMKQRQDSRRMPKILRTAAIAAMLAVALAVTAGAANLALDGALFEVVWSRENQMLLTDGAGNEVTVTTGGMELVTKENDRLILRVNGQELDITDELLDEGSYHMEYEETILLEDGREETQARTVDATGDLEEWTVVQSGGNAAYTETGGGEEDLPEAGEAVEKNAADNRT